MFVFFLDWRYAGLNHDQRAKRADRDAIARSGAGKFTYLNATKIYLDIPSAHTLGVFTPNNSSTTLQVLNMYLLTLAFS